MTESKEQMIAELRQSVAALESDVKDLPSISSTCSEEFNRKARTIGELITQALVKVDSVQISKDAAAEALRNGDRESSRKIAVLLARRKTIVKKLNSLGDEVDKLVQEKDLRDQGDAG